MAVAVAVALAAAPVVAAAVVMDRAAVVSAASGGSNSPTGVTAVLTNAEDGAAIYADRILGSMNRGVTTDYVAPALDIPTFRRPLTPSQASTANSSTGGGTGGGTAGNGGGGGGGGTGTTTSTTGVQTANDLAFGDGGSSLSSAIVTGAFAMVSSALDYWTSLNQTGVTSDAYLTQPVGATNLNYGANAFKDLSAYNNPDGINAILQWTAVPITNANDGLSASTPHELLASPNFPSYSRISVSNAIAAIEGIEALSYLTSHDDLKLIDANHDNNITTQELQTFVDTSAKTGNAEAGAMARLLGGTARIAPVAGFVGSTDPTATGYNGNEYISANSTTYTAASYNDNPEQPDVLQRRFNFFDYSADGNLNGSVTISQLSMLQHNLLPSPDSFVIVDRQRASANGYLINPTAQRNYTDLQHILPKYQWVPKSALTRYRNISPAQFKVDRGVQPGTTFPLYTLYNGPITRTGKVVNNITANPNRPTVVTNGSNGSSTAAAKPFAQSSTTAASLATTLNVAPANSVNVAQTSAKSSSSTTVAPSDSASLAAILNPTAAATTTGSTTSSASSQPTPAASTATTNAAQPVVVPPTSFAATTPTATKTANPVVTPTTAAPVVAPSAPTSNTSNTSAVNTARKVVATTKSKGFFNNVSSTFKKIFH